MSSFLHTIDSDEEVEAEVVSEDEAEEEEEKGRKPAKADKKRRLGELAFVTYANNMSALKKCKQANERVEVDSDG